AGRSRQARPPGSRAAQVLEAGLLVGADARLDDRAEGAVHHLVEVVRLVARAVVGDPVLREVVGADALRAVHPADLALAGVRRGRVLLLLLLREQARAQHSHRGLAVLDLTLLVLHRHDDPRREVRDAHRRVGRVDALAAGTRRAEHIHPDVVLTDLD